MAATKKTPSVRVPRAVKPLQTTPPKNKRDKKALKLAKVAEKAVRKLHKYLGTDIRSARVKNVVEIHDLIKDMVDDEKNGWTDLKMAKQMKKAAKKAAKRIKKSGGIKKSKVKK